MNLSVENQPKVTKFYFHSCTVSDPLVWSWSWYTCLALKKTIWFVFFQICLRFFFLGGFPAKNPLKKKEKMIPSNSIWERERQRQQQLISFFDQIIRKKLPWDWKKNCNSKKNWSGATTKGPVRGEWVFWSSKAKNWLQLRTKMNLL